MCRLVARSRERSARGFGVPVCGGRGSLSPQLRMGYNLRHAGGNKKGGRAPASPDYFLRGHLGFQRQADRQEMANLSAAAICPETSVRLSYRPMWSRNGADPKGKKRVLF